MRLLATTLRAIAATAVIAGIVLGAPAALWWLGAPLIDRIAPAGFSVLDLLLRPDDGTLLMCFLGLIGAAAWLVLTVSILAELVAALTDRSALRINLPGFRLGRAIAAALVAAIIGATPALASPAAAPTSVSVSAPAPHEPAPHDRTAVEPTAPGRAPAGPEYMVVARDSLWRIAELVLGDPLRWREIYDLNAGRVQPDGGRLTEASQLGIGWRLVLPSDARDVVRVAPGDTLTGLAAEHLGDPARADELFRANVGHAQPGNTALEDADLIRPGWTLTVPKLSPATTAPTSPTRPGPAGTDPSASGPADRPTRTPPTPRPPEPQRPDARPTRTTGSPPRATDKPTQPVNEPTQRTDKPAHTTNELTRGTDEHTRAIDEPNRPDLSVAALGVSSLVAAGTIAALAVRRRRQMRMRPARHRIAVPADDIGRVEFSATRSEVPASRHLDLALRSLSHPDRGELPVPVIRSIRMTSTDALITLATPAPPSAPFTAVGPAVSTVEWTLDADEELPVPTHEAAGCCAPFPTLVSIGTDDDRTLLVDLEQRQVLRIGGHEGRCMALLRHIAAELATSRMAEDAEVLLVGLADDPPSLNPDQQAVVPDLAAALTEVEQRATNAHTTLRQHGLGSVVEGRMRNIAADSWLPTVVLIGREPDDDQRARLDALRTTGPGTATVALVVFDPADPDLRIGDDGSLILPDVGDGPWQAAQLTETAGTQLAKLLGSADEHPVPVQPAAVTGSWTSGMCEDGSLGDEPTDNGPADPAGDAPAEPANDGPADEDPTGDSAGPVQVPARPAAGVDPEALRRLRIVEHQDPHLDADLAAWHATGPPTRPMIAILGDVTVRAPGTAPSTRPSWFAEVLIYLSLHPAGVTASKAAHDLWPDGHRISPATRRHAFFGARRWAGKGLGGDPAASYVSGMQNDGSYRLRGHLLDWDLFRRLRKRGQARHTAGHPGAVADYEAALGLVRGPVLAGLRPGGYAWLNNHDQRHDLQIPGFIVDTAHELVDIALAAGDTTTARRAAEQARMVDIDVAYDRPLIDLMRIAHAEDNQSELELYASVLLDARGFDVPEELAPDSFTVLNELLPAGPRRPKP